jgi:hypothetical protein
VGLGYGRTSKKGGETMEKRLTCAERIEEELRGRVKVFEAALRGEYPDGEYEDFIEWINEYALAYSEDPHYRAKRLELSWGGPQDYFLFFEDGTIEYWFLDWFDGANVELFGHDYEVMAQVRDILEGVV